MIIRKPRFDRVKGQSDLIYRGGVFYLIIVVDVPDKSEYDPIGVLGVDLGIENIAVDSDKEIFESKKVEDTRQRYSRLKSSLQHVGTKSAKRKLKDCLVRSDVSRKTPTTLYPSTLSQRLKAQLER